MLLLGLLHTLADHTIGGLITLKGRKLELFLLSHRQALISNQVNFLAGLAIL